MPANYNRRKAALRQAGWVNIFVTHKATHRWLTHNKTRDGRSHKMENKQEVTFPFNGLVVEVNTYRTKRNNWTMESRAVNRPELKPIVWENLRFGNLVVLSYDLLGKYAAMPA
jgi:hypothetical protein